MSRPCASLLKTAVVGIAVAAASIGSAAGRALARDRGPDTRVLAAAASSTLDIRRPAVPDARSDMSPAQKRLLDDLFRRLAKADDPAEAEGVAGAIRRVWLRSGSDTADLLMSRAGTAMGQQKMDLAEKLLDRVIALEPAWAEGWNRRATVRFHRDDDVGAMADIAQVLLREPRHFGALSGMGRILERHKMQKAALKVLRRVLELYPQQTDTRKLVDKLTIEVEGRDI